MDKKTFFATLLCLAVPVIVIAVIIGAVASFQQIETISLDTLEVIDQPPLDTHDTSAPQSNAEITTAVTTAATEISSSVSSPAVVFPHNRKAENKFEQQAIDLARATFSGAEEIDNNWALFLVGKDNPLPEDYQPEVEYVDGYFALDARCSEYAKLMLKVAAADGVTLSIASAYRDTVRQKINFDNLYESYIEDGYSEDQAYWITATVILPPGQSEHNAGICLDIASPDWFTTHERLTNDFVKTEQYAWLRENSWKYGFILRYPQDKNDITGVIHESWHYRFVGLYHAEVIEGLGITLEEYMELA